MNLNHVSYWDDARLRATVSRERAKAMRELRIRITAWLQSRRSFGTPRTAPRECLDCGA